MEVYAHDAVYRPCHWGNLHLPKHYYSLSLNQTKLKPQNILYGDINYYL